MIQNKSYRNVSWLFASNALINWTVSIQGIIDPHEAVATFDGHDPNYPSIIRLWQGFVFMFGCMFWEVSRDAKVKAALIKYNWIEKTITAIAITIGYIIGDIPIKLMVLIVFTNWLWIPFLIWADIAMLKDIKYRKAA